MCISPVFALYPTCLMTSLDRYVCNTGRKGEGELRKPKYRWSQERNNIVENWSLETVTRGSAPHVARNKTAAIHWDVRGEKIWRVHNLGKRFRYIGAETDITKAVWCRNKKQWQKIRTYVIKYKDKWGRAVRKREWSKSRPGRVVISGGRGAICIIKILLYRNCNLIWMPDHRTISRTAVPQNVHCNKPNREGVQINITCYWWK